MDHRAPEDFAVYAGDAPSEPLELGRSEQVRAASIAMVRCARRQIRILSRDLDGKLYDDADFVESMRRFVLDSHRARVRILVRSSGPAARSGHRLITLAHRLSSYIEVRRPSAEHAKYNSAMLLVDSRASIFRLHADRFDATIGFNDQRSASNLARTFDNMWDMALPDPNVRRLML